MSKKLPKIFIGFSNTSGYATRLFKGFTELGVESTFVSLGRDKFSYSDEKHKPWIVRSCEYLNINFRKTHKKNYPLHILWLLLFIPSLLILYIWSYAKYNVFIFIGGRTPLGKLDLRLLHLFRKKIIRVSLGSMTRPAYTDGSFLLGTYTGRIPTTKEIIAHVARQKELILFMEKYSTIFVDHIFQGMFHEKKYVGLQHLGIPIDTQQFVIDNSYSPKSEKNIRILHAASYKGHKGSAQINKVVSELISELKPLGYEIEYVELSNVPNHVVLQEINKCDFVIDELYSDNPMATFVAEAALLHKPAVCGGYSAEHIEMYYDKEFIPPVEYCHPNKIKDLIYKLIVNPEHRKSLGERAHQFACEHYNYKIVAEQYLRLATGNFPEDWYEDPQKYIYLHGCGLPESHLKETVTDMIALDGTKSLQLNDKPEAIKQYLKLIQ